MHVSEVFPVFVVSYIRLAAVPRLIPSNVFCKTCITPVFHSKKKVTLKSLWNDPMIVAELEQQFELFLPN